MIVAVRTNIDRTMELVVRSRVYLLCGCSVTALSMSPLQISVPAWSARSTHQNTLPPIGLRMLRSGIGLRSFILSGISTFDGYVVSGRIRW